MGRGGLAARVAVSIAAPLLFKGGTYDRPREARFCLIHTQRHTTHLAHERVVFEALDCCNLPAEAHLAPEVPAGCAHTHTHAGKRARARRQ